MIVDALGVEVAPGPRSRVVSLVPSTTESLHALGVPPVGVTRFCVHPAHARDVVKVGGTKDIEWDRLMALSPELVLGNVEENSREIHQKLTRRGVPSFFQFPRTLDDAEQDLLDLGALVGADATPHVQAVRAARAQLVPRAFRYAYLIWRQPWMASGAETFISALLGELGGTNALPGRYPTVELRDLADVDVLLLSSEPFPFAERHAAEVRAALPDTRVVLVDGEACSWHGVRMASSLRRLATEAATWCS